MNGSIRFTKAGSSDISTDTHFRYKHPYESEITGSKYPATVNVKSDPIPPLPFDSTEATLVDSPEAVNAMLEELKHAREIAVDLEHHSAHSFIGLVSLMQISTRDKDWIVDTLKPWREELQVLNEVFANPSIVKVSRNIGKLHIANLIVGFSRGLHGYGMASKRPWPVCGWLVRYVSCFSVFAISKEQPGSVIEALRQL